MSVVDRADGTDRIDPLSVTRSHRHGLASRTARRGRHGPDRARFLYVVVGFVLLLMFTPLAVVFVYSFNRRDSLVTFGGFSTRWYHEAIDSELLRHSLITSLEIAAATTVASGVIGTLLALSLGRGGRRFVRSAEGLVALRLVAPETVTAVALFVVITQLGWPLSATTIVLGHVVLCVPFVAVIVRSRLELLNPEVEHAAMDLGSTRLSAFGLASLPLLWPSIAAGSLLTFVISFDDFVTSFYNSGAGSQPLPLLIYSMLRFGVTPVVNAIGILMIVVTVVGTLLTAGLLRLARRQLVPAVPPGGRS